MTLISNDFLDETVSPPRLVGGRCLSTGEIKFPMPVGTLADEYERIHLKSTGTLWSYTVQRFPPGPPYLGIRDRTLFKPFGIGYVELEGEIIVEARIVTQDFDSLSVGLPMALTTDTFARADGNGSITTYAFKPALEDHT